MQTMILEIPDNKIDIMLNIVKSLKDDIVNKFEVKDTNLVNDSYFYERKEHVSQTIDDIESGKIKMHASEEFEDEMDLFVADLTKKYAN